ncbi:Solute carrier family 35 member F5 [Armadillidium vulgare]|nr:Solute carrier family 35 member F5 [Armadillidium vulgare]
MKGENILRLMHAIKIVCDLLFGSYLPKCKGVLEDKIYPNYNSARQTPGQPDTNQLISQVMSPLVAFISSIFPLSFLPFFLTYFRCMLLIYIGESYIELVVTSNRFLLPDGISLVCSMVAMKLGLSFSMSGVWIFLVGSINSFSELNENSCAFLTNFGMRLPLLCTLCSFSEINANSCAACTLCSFSEVNDNSCAIFDMGLPLLCTLCSFSEWFLGNYGYQEALSLTEVGVVNVISSTSGLFTLILASLFPSSSADKFSLSKLTAVLFIILGTALISIEELKLDGTSFPVGVMWSFVGALFYAFYMVFLKRQVPSEEKMDLPMFFGFVGLFNAIILWPGFFILNATGLEVFQVPTKQQLLYIILNGLVGTVLSELLFDFYNSFLLCDIIFEHLRGCFLTSSLMATLSLTLTIPMTMLCDIFLKGVVYSWHFYVGSIPVLFAFIAVTFLTHYEDKDPVLDGFKFFVRFCCKRKKDYRLVADDCNEQERLICTPNKAESFNNDEIERKTRFLLQNVGKE